MSLRIITSFSTLMKYAHELGQARLSGDSVRIAEAEHAHDAYKKMCLESDEMHLHETVGTLYYGNGRKKSNTYA